MFIKGIETEKVAGTKPQEGKRTSRLWETGTHGEPRATQRARCGMAPVVTAWGGGVSTEEESGQSVFS